jgi:hypothetical protein
MLVFQGDVTYPIGFKAEKVTRMVSEQKNKYIVVEVALLDRGLRVGNVTKWYLSKEICLEGDVFRPVGGWGCHMSPLASMKTTLCKIMTLCNICFTNLFSLTSMTTFFPTMRASICM